MDKSATEAETASSWCTISSAEIDLALENDDLDRDGPKEGQSLDDTLPVDLLPDYELCGSAMTADKRPTGAKPTACDHNITYVIHRSNLGSSICNEQGEILNGLNLELPEYSSEFCPVSCSSRLGKYQSDIIEFDPKMSSTKFNVCEDKNCMSLSIRALPSAIVKQRQPSISSEFNPVFSSTQLGFCDCSRWGKHCFLHQQMNRICTKSDLSERICPPCSSPVLRSQVWKGCSDSHSGRIGKRQQSDNSPLRRFPTDVQQCCEYDKPKLALTSDKSQQLFLPLKCSSALNDSLVFNPRLCSTAVMNCSNISEMENLKLHSNRGD